LGIWHFESNPRHIVLIIVANNNCAAAELWQFADGMWRAGDDDGGEATAAELDDENARLREVVKLKRSWRLRPPTKRPANGYARSRPSMTGWRIMWRPPPTAMVRQLIRAIVETTCWIVFRINNFQIINSYIIRVGIL